MADDLSTTIRMVSVRIDVLKKLQDLAIKTQSIELQEGILELREQLLEVKESLLEIREENLELKEENASLKKKLVELENPEFERLIRQGDEYFTETGGFGPYCPVCHENGRHRILLSKDGVIHTCSKCGYRKIH
jgi:regulator of replication initiation timing